MTNQAHSDIVERLRGTADSAEEAGFTHAAEIAREAADEIERLHAKIERLHAEGASIFCEAADRIKQQGEEIERLRAQAVVLFDSIKSNADEIERLRRLCQDLSDVQRQNEETYGKAADEIERLRTALVRQQQPEGRREEQVAEWLRSRGYKVNA